MSDQETTELTPSFIIYLNGTRFSAEQESDVREITVQNRIDSPSTFSVTMSDMGRKWTDLKDFSEGSEFRIMLGYKDAVEEVMCGEMTGIFPAYRQNADDLTTFRGTDRLRMLHKAKMTRSFTGMTDSDIVKQIANEYGLKSETEGLATLREFTVQRNMTDFEYLSAMAMKSFCRMRIADGTLYFSPIKDGSDEEIIVEWGKTLIEFNSLLNTTPLLSAVEVRGWDIENNVPIVGLASVDDITFKVGGEDLGGTLARDSFGESMSIVVDNEIRDQNSADSMALNLITENSFDYISGTGKSQGNNRIMPGTQIEIKELGTRFSGKYFVNSVTHRFAANQGYVTLFGVSRNTTA